MLNVLDTLETERNLERKENLERSQEETWIYIPPLGEVIDD